MAADFELPRWAMDAYNGELDEVTRKAIAELIDFLSDYDLDDMDDAARMALRDETIAKVNALIEDYGDATASVAADFREELQDMAGDVGKSVMPSGFDARRTDRAVRRAAGSLFGDGADIGAFADSVSTFLARVVSHRADECVVESAVAANEESEKKGQKGKKKFARIPSGPSCGFCIMLASRGFVYATRKSAGELTRFHNECDCRIVEGYEGMAVEGYDPKGMYDRYRSCRDAIRADADPSPIRRDWNALPDEEKAKFFDPRDPRKRPSYDQYLQRRIVDEMNTRDRQWLYDGAIQEVDYSSAPRSSFGKLKNKSDVFNPADYEPDNIFPGGNEWRDLFVHDALANRGYRVKTRSGAAIGLDGKVIDGVTTPDISIDDVIWEIKSPRDGGSHTSDNDLSFIEEAFKSARHNFRNPYDESSHAGMGDMRDEIRVVLNTRYRTYMANDEAVAAEIERRMRRANMPIEVLWVDSAGNVRHFKK